MVCRGTKKGSPFEREKSKDLSLWWTYGERDDTIWRTDASGGRATSRTNLGKKTKYAYGDFTFTDPTSAPLFDLFLIEAKRGYTQRKEGLKKSQTLCLLDLIDSKKKNPLLIEWWDKIKSDKEAAKRPYAMLIFRRDNKEECVVIENSFINDLTVFVGKNLNTLPNIKTYVHYILNIFRSEDFFEFVSPSDIIEIHRKNFPNLK